MDNQLNQTEPQDIKPDAQAMDPNELDLLRKKSEEYLALAQRATADYQNLKKQSEKDKEDIMKFASAAIVLELLPIYDNMKRAVEHIPANERSLDWAKGIGHIVTQFKQFFSKMGIEEIATVGQKFDPAKHHAIGKEKVEGTAPDTVIAEVGTGFMMQGKVIEPAKVRVAE